MAYLESIKKSESVQKQCCTKTAASGNVGSIATLQYYILTVCFFPFFFQMCFLLSEELPS